jgi:hypothetical protein
VNGFTQAESRAFEQAFFSELEKLGAVSKLAGLGIEEELLKEALPAMLGQAAQGLAQGARAAGQGVKQLAVGKMIPTGVAGAGGKEMLLRQGGLFGGLMGTGHRMEQAGMQMRQTMAQRVAQTPGLSAAAQVTSPGQMQEIAQAARAMGRSDPGAAGRVASHVVESTGHHINHASPAALAFKSVGVPIGGALEGLARGGGRELQRSSVGAVQGVGRGLERNAKLVGRVGEMAGVPALALGAHIPLGAAGLIGGKMLGAAMPAMPAAEAALHHAGDIGHYIHHGASDLLGEGARQGAALKAKFLGRRAGAAGGALNALGEALS